MGSSLFFCEQKGKDSCGSYTKNKTYKIHMKRGLTKKIFPDILLEVWAKIHVKNVKKQSIILENCLNSGKNSR